MSLKNRRKTMSEKRCYDCRFYRPYYVKGYIRFDKLDMGQCRQTETTVEKHGGCEKFQNMHYCRIDRKQAALAALTENLNAIGELKQILEDDESEALEEFFAQRKLQKERERIRKEKERKK